MDQEAEFDKAYRRARHDDGGGSADLIKRGRAELTEIQRASFSELAHDRPFGTIIDYRLEWPKLDFLNFLCDECGLVAHGSKHPGLERLEPIRISTDSTSFGRRALVFGTPDAVWALWFAILDKGNTVATSNDCTRLTRVDGGWVKYYYFFLSKGLADCPPFTPGVVYFCDALPFSERHHLPHLDQFGAEFEERGSPQSVVPRIGVPVVPSDFPYLDQVEYVLP